MAAGPGRRRVGPILEYYAYTATVYGSFIQAVWVVAVAWTAGRPVE